MMHVNAIDVTLVKENYPIGTRLRLIHIDDPYTHLKNGSEGKVNYVDDAGTIHMIWDSGSTLGLIPGIDEFVKIKK